MSECNQCEIPYTSPDGEDASVVMNGERYSFCDLECLARWAVDTTSHYELEQLDYRDYNRDNLSKRNIFIDEVHGPGVMRKNSLTDAKNLTQEALDYTDEYSLRQIDADYLLALSWEEADTLQSALSLAMIRLEQENDNESLKSVYHIFLRMKYGEFIDA
jgi:hypothetical protein